MSSLEAKRDKFRNYLERCGLIDALSKALIKLYQEPNKPDDAVGFVRKYMCESCPDEDAYNIVKADFEEANKTIIGLKRELERVKDSIRRTPSQIKFLLEDGMKILEENDECKSLLKKYLKDTMYEDLIKLSTSNKATIIDCIQSGLANPSAAVGIYAADSDAYEVFSTIFGPVINEYHGQSDAALGDVKQPTTDWGDPTSFGNLDPDEKFILSTRIRCARNIDGYPYFAKMTEQHYEEIHNKVKEALDCMEGDHKGIFYSLENMSLDAQNGLIDQRILFTKDNVHLKLAGAYKFWPLGRGIFYNTEKTFIVWINEEDHMRIISMMKSGNLGAVYQRLVTGLSKLEEKLTFSRNDQYGYLTSCPTNLGTTLRVSVHIKLPKLSGNAELLKEKTDELNLQIRGTGGEHTEIIEGVMDISNKRRFGATEYDIIKELYDGVLELINIEKEL